ncbi:DUF5666 domain-containing protein [Cognatilysobacter lacus]|uniref:DUF5666 domain-containing protein n=1 Tax=Cognatilysobacter lacus TaxID=1643323 RepID=A0A5D8Z899_9GAMM|nr:DUF5666 domain-containing protein [Lysobacter lacus]TZF90776.1 hypothetical protein FW784_04000 [Lysobacter lacus]
MEPTVRSFGVALATGAVLLLSGCVTPGGYGADGGYGEPAGYPSQQYPSQYGAPTEGVVQGVDPRSGRLAVVAQDPRTGRDVPMELRFDARTRLTYQGRAADVGGLERGDVIRFDAVPSGNELYVRDIEVVRNVREGGYSSGNGNAGGAYGGNAYGPGADLRGAVTFVDTRTRTIRLDGGGYGGAVQVVYDARTSVEYQGRAYRPEDLERGDQVRVQARQVGANQWLAERIIVERSVR